MNNLFEIHPINKDEINYLVRNLEDFEKDRAIKDGLKAAGNVFKVGGKERLRSRRKGKGTGNLARSFIVRVKRNKPGVLIGFKQGMDGGSHSHLVDRGTNERFYKTKKGKNRSTGKVIGNLFWSDTESQDYPKAANELYNGIEKAVTRISNRQ